jgi:hypothetical protein
MKDLKNILTYISGMLTLAVILIGADLYQKKAGELCFNQGAPVQDIGQLIQGEE